MLVIIHKHVYITRIRTFKHFLKQETFHYFLVRRLSQDYKINKMNFRSKLMCWLFKLYCFDDFISLCSFVFWIGDLNYRLGNLEYDRCIQLVKDKQYDQLMNYDQVSKSLIKKWDKLLILNLKKFHMNVICRFWE